MAATIDAPAAPRGVDAGRGFGWWGDAWQLFKMNPGMWIVMALIMIVIFFVLAFIPFLGALATTLLGPAFFGSWILAARKVEGGGALELGDTFSAFKDKLTPLVVLGALLLVASLALAFAVGVLGAGAVFGAFAGGNNVSAGGILAAVSAGLLAILLALSLGVVLGMLYWFAPALVLLHDMSPVDAMKASFAACLKNVLPFVLYTIAYVVAALVATIPFGLGWIVLVPLLMLTAYTSYKDVFGA